jgi:putative ABC transport system substrate-binding protein
MKRREFIALLGGAAPLTLPFAAPAQQTRKIPIIGVLNLAQATTEEWFRRGLRDLGYVEGQNVVIIARYADGQQERLPNLVNELLGLGVHLFVSASTQAIQEIRKVNSTVPIVMCAISDPIGSGLIPSLARPGNTTGVTLLSTDAAGKRLELLNDLIPGLSKVAVLAQRDHPPTAALRKETDEVASRLRIAMHMLEVAPDDFDAAFRDIVSGKAAAVVIQQTATFAPHMRRLAGLALQHRLATIHENRFYVLAGGLMSYGADTRALGRRGAVYADRILKGTSPADLPVEQPTQFYLVINMKIAKALDLNVPPALLARADEVIE